MEREFARIGVTFERLPAVDGRALPPGERDVFQSTRCEAKPEGWLPGEIGCFLSHFKAWQTITAGDDAWAAVFEDDVTLAEDLRLLLAATDWIPADADLVRLEANRSMRLSGGRETAVAKHRKVYRALSGSAGAAGYLLAKTAAARLIAAPPSLHTAADVFLFKPKASPMARALRRYQVVPAVCVQDGVRGGETVSLKSLIRDNRNTRGRGYRERSNPLLRLWPIRRHAVAFRP